MDDKLMTKINSLKEEKNAVVLFNYYQLLDISFDLEGDC